MKLQRPPPEIRIFLPARFGALQDCDAPATFARLDRAHQSGGAGAQDDCVKFLDHNRRSLFGRIACRERLLHSLAGIGSG